METVAQNVTVSPLTGLIYAHTCVPATILNRSMVRVRCPIHIAAGLSPASEVTVAFCATSLGLTLNIEYKISFNRHLSEIDP